MARILVVEDDRSLAEAVGSVLRTHGHESVVSPSANEAFHEMYGELFDLVISDVVMPRISGFQFAATVRGLDEDIPILLMTARDDLESKRKGFRAGADDYVVKPFDLEELLLRVEALLRRARISTAQELVVGDVVLDTAERVARVKGEEVRLTPREFNLLHKFLLNPRKTFTRAQLMDEFWETGSSTGPRAVDVYITKLRQKLAHCDDFEIVTMHGLGYKAVPR